MKSFIHGSSSSDNHPALSPHPQMVKGVNKGCYDDVVYSTRYTAFYDCNAESIYRTCVLCRTMQVQNANMICIYNFDQKASASKSKWSTDNHRLDRHIYAIISLEHIHG